MTLQNALLYLWELLDKLSLIITTIGTIGTIFFGILSYYYYNKVSHLNKERRRVTWNDLPIESRELKRKIMRDFKPNMVFTPCRRGATIANLMFSVDENILLYVGIREDLRVGKKLESPPKDYEIVSPTGKYKHYIPKALLNEKMDVNLLILDDFADTGDSLKTIVDFLLEKGFQRSKIKTATIVCSETALRGEKEPDFFSLKMPSDFYFPWGRAR